MNRSKTYFYMTYFTHIDVLEPISGNYAHPVVSALYNYLFSKGKKDIVGKKDGKQQTLILYCNF